MSVASDSAAFVSALREAMGGVTALSDEQGVRLLRHFRLLVKWNQRINLTAVRDPLKMIERHYCESLFLAAHLPSGSIHVVDIGAGAGFPGIGVAVLLPEAVVTFVESNQKKAAFLKEATRNWPNVKVVAARAESLEARYDWMVSRAVAWRELPRAADHIAVLGSEPVPEFPWRQRIPLPWGDRRVLLIGDVPRGT